MDRSDTRMVFKAGCLLFSVDCLTSRVGINVGSCVEANVALAEELGVETSGFKVELVETRRVRDALLFVVLMGDFVVLISLQVILHVLLSHSHLFRLSSQTNCLVAQGLLSYRCPSTQLT